MSATSAFTSSDSLSVGGAPLSTATMTDAELVAHKETHWMADLALGRDIIGSGADAMQFKFGMRIAELRATTNSRESASETGINIGGILNNNFFIAGDTNFSQNLTFLGAGPRFGIEGSAPIARGWCFSIIRATWPRCLARRISIREPP